MRYCNNDDAMIYHIVTAADLRAHLKGNHYHPPSLADHGFVHCALKPSVTAVADDYFSATTEPLLVLEIDTGSLTSEVRHEEAAPLAGGGTSHLVDAPLFPHVYGPIDRQAISGVGVLRKTQDGSSWPGELVGLVSFLEPR